MHYIQLQNYDVLPIIGFALFVSAHFNSHFKIYLHSFRYKMFQEERFFFPRIFCITIFLYLIVKIIIRTARSKKMHMHKI